MVFEEYQYCRNGVHLGSRNVTISAILNLLYHSNASYQVSIHLTDNSGVGAV